MNKMCVRGSAPTATASSRRSSRRSSILISRLSFYYADSIKVFALELWKFMKNLKSPGRQRTIRIALMVYTFSYILTSLVFKRLGILSWELGS